MSQAPSILLIRLSSLGDIVLVVPLIAALREKYPESRIDLAVRKEYAEIAAMLPGLTQIHILDTETGRSGMRLLRAELGILDFDWVLDLHNNFRSRFLRRGIGQGVGVIRKRTFRRWLLVRFKINRMKGEPDVVGRYFETAEELGIVDPHSSTGILACDPNPHATSPRRIAMAPGSRHFNKRWPAAYFSELAKKLIATGATIELYGSHAEAELCETIASSLPPSHARNFAGILTLAESASHIARCSLAVTNDSGLMHLASALGVPVVAIFGATTPDLGFAPRAENARIVENLDLDCRPCTAVGLDHCPKGHFRCMMDVMPGRVFVEVETAIGKE